LKNIFLTGASSFLGNNLIPKLANYKIYGLEHQTPLMNFKNLISVKVEKENLNSFYNDNNIEIIVHLAANSNVSNNQNDFENLINTNVIFGNNVLLSAKNSSVKKIISSGSYSQYINETPSSFYKISKQIFETLLSNFSSLNNVKSRSLCFGDIYGPNDNRNKLIPYLLKNENKKSVRLNSDGLGYFSPIHVNDATDSIMFEVENENSQIFKRKLICSELLTVKEFINIYKTVRNKSFTPIFANKNRISSYKPNNLTPDVILKTDLETGLIDL
jgi:nucleoside-diphosphate-sugar epimerase